MNTAWRPLDGKSMKMGGTTIVERCVIGVVVVVVMVVIERGGVLVRVIYS